MDLENKTSQIDPKMVEIVRLHKEVIDLKVEIQELRIKLIKEQELNRIKNTYDKEDWFKQGIFDGPPTIMFNRPQLDPKPTCGKYHE